MNPFPLRAKRAAAGLMIAGVLLQGAALMAAPGLDVPAARQEANARLRLGQYEEAIELYVRIAAAEPGVASLDDLMLAYWNAGRFDEAKRTASRVLRLDPGNADAVQVAGGVESAKNRDLIPALRAKAVAAFQRQDYAESAVLYEQIVRQDPTDFLALRDLMWTYWRQEKYPEAVDRAQLVLAQHPQDPEALDVVKTAPVVSDRKSAEALYSEVKQRLQENQFETAIPILRRLVETDPKNTAYRHQLLSALIRAGRDEEALRIGRELTESNKEDYLGWNALARAQTAVHDSTSALESFGESLRINPHQPDTTVAAARIRLKLRDFDLAEHMISDLEVSTALPSGAYPVKAEALFWTNRYKESLPYWSKTVELSSDNVRYRFLDAWARSFVPGEEDDARRRMAELVEKNHDRRAVNFLVDDALSHGRTEAAVGFLEDWLKDIEPRENLVPRLAAVYQSQKQWSKLDKLMDRFLAVNPQSQYAWVMKAEAALRQRRFAAAEQAARKVLGINPSNEDGHETLAEALSSQGRDREAVREMETFLSLNPTNPPAVAKYARALYDAHEERRAKEFLKKWLDENRRSAVLPVFLYHGLTPFPHDPMLSYPFHHYVGVFENHIRALHDEGYTPVTIAQVNAWLLWNQPLPPRPVLITFDDGRTDSFVFADPILKKYGFKATMMSALLNIEGYPTPDPPPGYASWDRIKEFRDSGRWEIQGHGDVAHAHVSISSAGVQGMFLVNRQWLGAEGRLETVDEWSARIDHDYRSAQEKMLAHLGSSPSGFAYPEGSYGQMDDNCNVPESAQVNQSLVKKYYQTAYVQDSIGINIHSQDRGRMNRVEPNNAWSGQDLIRHIQDENPFSKTYQQFIEWAAWEGRTREAYGWLAELKAGGASDATVTAADAQIRLFAGDFAGGEAQAQQILSSGNFPGLETTLRVEGLEGGVSWNPSYTFQNDNDGRQYWQLNQNLFFPRRGNLQLYAVQRHAEFMETGSPLVVDNAVGAGASYNLGLYHRLGLTFLQHLFSDAEAAVSAAGKADSRWTDDFSTQFEVGYSPLTNALALTHDILGTYGAAAGRWEPDELWKLSLREEWTAYSDANHRSTLEGEADRVLYVRDQFAVKGIDRLTYDDAKEFSPNYYSPQRLWLEALGPELTYDIRRRAQLILRYLPGYSTEAGSGSHFVNEAEAAIEYRWNDVNSVRPSYTHYDTPQYHANSYSIELTQHF